MGSHERYHLFLAFYTLLFVSFHSSFHFAACNNTMANPSDSGDLKRIQKADPIHMRLLYGVCVTALQTVVFPGADTYRGLKEFIFKPETAPTLTKTYKCRSKLPIRIFFPKSYNRASPQPLPLLFSIHGGGFVGGSTPDNDAFNRKFSDTNTTLVIALNYAKAPGNPFPGQTHDLEALVEAVFVDEDLTPHIDPAKVAMTGFSAGGNLTMTVTQTPAVRKRITAGIVPIYPVTDLTVPPTVKAQTRRYKTALGGTRSRTKDPLLIVAPAFEWACECALLPSFPSVCLSTNRSIQLISSCATDIPTDQDLQHPQLSPFYAERSDLPKRMWFVGCELDMLGHEAWRAACKFAGKPVPGLDQPIGKEEPTDGGKAGTIIWGGDERFAFGVKDGESEVRWLCLPDAGHCFEMADRIGGDAEELEDGVMKMDGLIKEMGKWLYAPQ